MKPLILAALLLASCVPVQKSVQPKAPDYAQQFADALCARDSSYVAANAGGRLAAPVYDIEAYFETLPSCSGARFITTDNGHFLFILHENDLDASYLLYFDEAKKCVDLR